VSKNTKVLLIEDSKDLAIALTGIFKLRGIDLKVAKNGVEGIDMAKREKPALILLDLMLPKLSGFEVCKILKTDNTTWRIPIVVVSTLSQSEYMQRAKELGADHFITKPYNLDELVAQVLRLI